MKGNSRSKKTEYSQRPQELSQEPLRFPLLPNAFPDPILITGTTGAIYYVNPAWEKLTGYTLDEVRGNNPRFLKSGKTPKNVYGNLWQALKKGESFSTEEIIDRAKNGKEYNVRSVFFPIRHQGKNQYFVQVQYDITEQKNLIKKLRENEEKYRDLMEQSSEGIIIYAADGQVMEANQKICTMLGYTKKELCRFHQYEFTDPDDLAQNPPRRSEILSGKTIRNERVLIRKDGSRLHVELTAKLHFNNTIQIFYRDISERKNIERQKDTFIGVAAHELKTPITSLKAYGQLLNKKLLKLQREDLSKLISQMDIQISRLTALVDDLLNVNRIASGRLELYKKKQNLNLVLQETAVELQPLVTTHVISITGKITRKVNFDENRIRQVLTNLLTNAVKYSPSANKIVISIKKIKDTVQVGVQDFGIGIAKDDQDKIFELFYRTSDTERGSISGFGLGLYIASEIVKKHGGKLWVESEKGKGSTFYFSLPL